jgi:hypothetical protein
MDSIMRLTAAQKDLLEDLIYKDFHSDNMEDEHCELMGLIGRHDKAAEMWADLEQMKREFLQSKIEDEL